MWNYMLETNSSSFADLNGAAPTVLTLESTDGTAFKITEVSPPVVKDVPVDAATKHVLKVDWALWEETGRQKRVLVKTDHPKAPQLSALVRRSMNPNDKDAPTPPTGPRPMTGPGTTELITAIRKPDISKIKAELGWEPTVALRDGLKSMVADFAARLKVELPKGAQLA